MVVFMSGQTQTHNLGFLLVADSAATSGEDRLPQNKQWPNGNAAHQRGAPTTPPPPPRKPISPSPFLLTILTSAPYVPSDGEGPPN